MNIRIDALNPTVVPQRDHEFPAMRDGLTVKLRTEQILGLGNATDPQALKDFSNVDAAVGRAALGAMVELQPRVDIASDEEVVLADASSPYVRITGTNFITSFGAAPTGLVREVLFEDGLTLTHSSSLMLPGAGDIQTRAGDTALFRREADGWRCIRYSRSDALPSHFVRVASIAVTSGTSHVVAGIPSWARRIEINLSKIRKTGSQAVQVRIGNSGGLQDTGYVGGSGVLSSTPSATAISTGIQLITTSASARRHGKIVLSLANAAQGVWAYQGFFWDSGNTIGSVVVGTVVSASLLDRVALVALDGEFDGDSESRFQVSYEG